MGNTPPVLTPELEEAMEKYSLDENTIAKLSKSFKELDTLGLGHLDKVDFYAALGMKRNYFADKVFEIVDLDGDDEISFYEFVCCTCSYCSMNHSQILRFCFDLFDKDNSGYLDEVCRVQIIFIYLNLYIICHYSRADTKINILSWVNASSIDDPKPEMKHLVHILHTLNTGQSQSDSNIKKVFSHFSGS